MLRMQAFIVRKHISISPFRSLSLDLSSLNQKLSGLCEFHDSVLCQAIGNAQAASRRHLVGFATLIAELFVRDFISFISVVLLAERARH